MIELDHVLAAARVLHGVAHRTPVLTSRRLDERVGAELLLKAENLQRVGAFKFRGAYHRLAALDAEQRAAGVVSASSGNHAQAVALAARLVGTHATILMPHDAPAGKLAATEGYGAEVVRYDRYAEDRDALQAALARDRGATIVPAYDDPHVMAGQGTAALELLEQTGEGGPLDLVLVPVGGGGLAAGVSTVVAARGAGALTVGVEPAAGDDTARSLAVGERVSVGVPRTIADGQQTSTPGALTFEVVRRRVAHVVTVTDDEIREAMRVLFDVLKVVAEPSGACALAAVLAGRVDVAGRRVGVLLSGGNVGHRRFAELVG